MKRLFDPNVRIFFKTPHAQNLRRGILLFLSSLLVCTLFLATGYAQEATGGIGVILEFLPEKKIHRIRAVFQGSPAAKSKIQPGDLIVQIDGENTDKMDFETLGSKVRGQPGTLIKLLLKPSGTEATREVSLTRVSARSVSPLIVSDQPGSLPKIEPGNGSGAGTSGNLTPQPIVFTEAEKERIKSVILKLQTPEERKKMEKLLMELKEGKIIKSDFFQIMKALFPGK